MCNPALISMGVSVAGVGMQAYGAYSSAQGQKQATLYNAEVGEKRAQDTLMRGRHEVAKHQGEVTRLKSSQVAAMAANGLDVGYGSSLDILVGSDVQGDADAGLIRYNAEREAWGHRTGVEMDRYAADSINPMMSGASSFLTGAGSVASQWYTFKDRGMV